MVRKLCSRSQGQPVPGVRSAAMISMRRAMSREGFMRSRPLTAGDGSGYVRGVVSRDVSWNRRGSCRAASTSPGGCGSTRTSSSETFVRASGPGGQNVNKVSSAVQLRFDVRARRRCPARCSARLERLAGCEADQRRRDRDHRQPASHQAMNREDARARLVALIAQAAVVPKRRIATKPSRGAKERRVDEKKRRSGVKALRQSKRGHDD